jgi:SanA protein
MLLINRSVNKSADGKIYTDINKIPSKEVAVVLGTSRWLTNGYENNYFTYRINAAANLYLHGKVKKILVSGDNGQTSYNEPYEMFDALVDAGVPAEDIVLDYAGFRTFDSMVRANKVFGLNNFIVVSQDWHCERAIYIGQSKNISMIGFAAKDPNISTKTQLREYPARVSAFLDCYIMRTNPKYLGDPIVVMR